MRKPGFLIDVPVTLTVAVRGMSKTQAKELARRLADGLDVTDSFLHGFNDGLRKQGLLTDDVEGLTEASLESPTDECCEVIGDLEAED